MPTANFGLDFKSLKKHEDYYITSADLCIMVEHIQFRVHRYFFERESKWFSGKLVTPASPGAQPQGSTDSTAIILENLTSTQFARFLWVFYNPRYSLYEAGVDTWEDILSLAERWSFPEVKNLAIRELEKKVMLDVKRIKLYQDNDVDRNYLIPRYAALCEREEPLTLDEGMDLGMKTTLQIAAGREQARSRLSGGARTPLSPTIHGADLHEVIRELFSIAPPTAQKVVHNSETTVNTTTEPPTTAANPGTETPAGDDNTDTQNSDESDKKVTKGTGNGTVIDTGDAHKGPDFALDDPVSTPTTAKGGAGGGGKKQNKGGKNNRA